MKDKRKSESPDIHFLLITFAGKIDIVSLDDIELSEKDVIQQAISDAIYKYGENNVRYCKVVPLNIQKVVQIDE